MAIKAIYTGIDEIPETFRELYSERGGQYVLTGVEGVKTQADLDKLNEALRKERTDHKTTRDRLAAFGDLDPANIHATLEEAAENKTRIETLTKEGKLDESKLAERIQAAVNSAVGPVERDKKSLERQLEAQKKATAEKESLALQLQESIKQGKIEGALRDAAIASKVIPTAIDDAVLVGSRVFELNDHGEIVTKDGFGVVPGLSPKEYLKDMAEKRPHWWPPSVGGGAGGNRAGGGGGDNPWSAGKWNVTAQGRYVREHGVDKAREMAARVGSTLGAVNPPKEAGK